MNVITAVGLAAPECVVDQPSVKACAADIFKSLPRLGQLLSIFDNAGVERRRLCFDLDYYRKARSFGDNNRDYVEQGLPLIERAVQSALERAGLRPEAVDHLFFVTTTGVATPSLDALLMNRLPFRRTVKRTPMFGLGCAAGAVALARAAESPGTSLVVSLELCGQTFDPRDVSQVNLIAAALFGDGAAAAVLQPSPRPGFSVVDSRSLFFPNSLGMMGWDVLDTGFKLILSPELPDLMRQEARSAVESLLSPRGLSIGDIRHWIIHPGGPRVMDAFEASLSLTNGALRHSREFLREYGNLSSASVLYVLDRVMKADPRPGEWAMLMAAGPGFSFELMLLQAA